MHLIFLLVAQLAAVVHVCRDNTGYGTFASEVVIPTVDFPSDHVLISADFQFRPNQPSGQGACASVQPETCEGQQISRVFESCSDRKVETMPCPCPANHSARPSSRAALEQGGGSDAATTNPTAEASDTAESHGREESRWLGVVQSMLLSRARWCSDDESLAELDPDPQSEDSQAFCERHFVRFISRSRGGGLDMKNRLLAESEDRSIGILFSSRPFSIIMCKREGQLGLVGSALIFLSELALNIWAIRKFSTLQGDQFRLSAESWDLRNGSLAQIGPVDELFGVLYGGCRLHCRFVEFVTFSGRQGILASFTQPVEIDGWYFQFQDFMHNADLDAVDFRFEVFDHGHWAQVGNPPWIRQSAYRSTSNFQLDFRPPWTWLLQWCAGLAVLAVGCITASACGAAHQGRWAAWVCVFTYLSFAIINTVVAFSHVISYDKEERNSAATDCVLSCAFLLLAAVLAKERYVAAFFPWVYLAICVAIVYDKCAYYPNMLGFMSLLFPILWAGSPVLVGLFEILGTFLVRNWVLVHLVGSDRIAFDKNWIRILHSETIPLQKLNDCALSINQMCSEGEIRQRHRGADSEGSRTYASIESPPPVCSSNFQRLPLVTNLDQLYSKAACLNIFLRKKIKHLALSTNGCFAVKRRNESSTARRQFCRYEDFMAKQHNFGVEFAKSKPTQRALEKLLRVYDCDVSRLLDCCRQTIYFETVENIVCCLEAISCDQDIIILKIQNRMRPSYDSVHSAGFRYRFDFFCM